MHNSSVAVYLYVCTHANKLRHMHEAIFENRLAYARLSSSDGHQGHVLGLQIRGKTRERRGRHVAGERLRVVARDHEPARRLGDVGADSTQLVNEGTNQRRATAEQLYLSTGNCRRYGISSGFDAVRQHRMGGGVQLLYAVYNDR